MGEGVGVLVGVAVGDGVTAGGRVGEGVGFFVGVGVLSVGGLKGGVGEGTERQVLAELVDGPGPQSFIAKTVHL